MRESSSIRRGHDADGVKALGRGDGVASALDRCHGILQQLDLCPIRDPRARRWISTIRKVVRQSRESNPVGEPQGQALSPEDQAAFARALDQLSAWLEAEPRRLLWQ